MCLHARKGNEASKPEWRIRTVKHIIIRSLTLFHICYCYYDYMPSIKWDALNQLVLILYFELYFEQTASVYFLTRLNYSHRKISWK